MSSNRPTSSLITLRSQPLEGVKAIQRTMDFTVLSILNDDFLLEIQDGIISDIQSVKIDNSNNAFPITIYFPGVGHSGDTVTCPANAVLYSPVIVQKAENYHYTAASAGAVKVPVTFMNIELPYLIIPLGSSKASVITGTYVNHSLAMTGASETIIPANSARIRAVIQNPSTNNNSMFINFNAAATADNFSQELLPGQSFDTGAGPLSLTNINIIGTNGDLTFAYELHS